MEGGSVKLNADSSDDEVGVVKDFVKERLDANSSEDEGVVVRKSPSLDSSDEEVTVRKKKAVIESDDDDGANSDQNEKMDAESSDDARQGKERSGHKSKSAVMEEIRSDSQQMVRKAAVGLPYNRPRTLEEFLNQVVAKHSGKESAGRKSKSAAMQEIRSESHGRSAVPPPRTLEEFLNRRLSPGSG